MGLYIESMGVFLQSFIRREFEEQIASLHLADDEIEILKAVTHYELHTSEQIRQILRQRVQQVLNRLRPSYSLICRKISPDLIPSLHRHRVVKIVIRNDGLSWASRSRLSAVADCWTCL